MPSVHYRDRELVFRLEEGESVAEFAELGTLLVQFLDPKLRPLGRKILRAIGNDPNTCPTPGGGDGCGMQRRSPRVLRNGSS